ncbi:unnamed protein product, partial [Amoebophrya sp. A25]
NFYYGHGGNGYGCGYGGASSSGSGSYQYQNQSWNNYYKNSYDSCGANWATGGADAGDWTTDKCHYEQYDFYNHKNCSWPNAGGTASGAEAENKDSSNEKDVSASGEAKDHEHKSTKSKEEDKTQKQGLTGDEHEAPQEETTGVAATATKTVSEDVDTQAEETQHTAERLLVPKQHDQSPTTEQDHECAEDTHDAFSSMKTPRPRPVEDDATATPGSSLAGHSPPEDSGSAQQLHLDTSAAMASTGKNLLMEDGEGNHVDEHDVEEEKQDEMKDEKARNGTQYSKVEEEPIEDVCFAAPDLEDHADKDMHFAAKDDDGQEQSQTSFQPHLG